MMLLVARHELGDSPSIAASMIKLICIRIPPISFRQIIIRLWQPFAGDSGFPVEHEKLGTSRAKSDFGEIVSLVLTVCMVLFLTKTFIAYRDHDKADMPPQILGDEFFVSV